jgi:translation initiation factor IF-3
MSFDKTRYAINNRIRSNIVRVTHENSQLGVMNIQSALEYAFRNGLDLILTVPNANPPVCIVEDFGKFSYENKRKEKEVKKKQKETVQQIKEIRLTPTIGDHDLDTKIKAMESFLSDNKIVQVVMKFTRREINHKDIGSEKINKIVERIKLFGTIESRPNFMGLKLVCRFAPIGKKQNESTRTD